MEWWGSKCRLWIRKSAKIWVNFAPQILWGTYAYDKCVKIRKWQPQKLGGHVGPYGSITQCQCVRAGNVWIYDAFSEFTTTPGDYTYCHPTLYWYAFWITTAGYILLGVFIVGACIIMCCVFCCASLCAASSD